MSESRELAHPGEQGSAVSTRAAPTSIPMEQQLQMMQTALTDPNVDPAKAREMFTLLREMQNDARKAEFNRDLIAAKHEIPPIVKRGRNTHQNTKYAKMEDIQRVTDPILHRFGLSLEFKIAKEGPELAVTPVLRHVNGWVEEGETLRGPPDEGPGRSKIQSIGSASSYLQRYAAKGALNLRFDGEDDDGVPVLPSDQLNDRQARIAEEGELHSAVSKESYDQWFASLPPRDRAWMISSGRHAQFGGAPLLPGQSGMPPREPEPRKKAPRGGTEPPQGASAPPADQGGQTDEAPRQKRTLEQLVEAYEAGVRSQNSLDDLAAYQSLPARADWITKMKDGAPALYERIVKVNTDRYAELSAREAEGESTPSGDDLFGEDEG